MYSASTSSSKLVIDITNNKCASSKTQNMADIKYLQALKEILTNFTLGRLTFFFANRALK